MYQQLSVWKSFSNNSKREKPSPEGCRHCTEQTCMQVLPPVCTAQPSAARCCPWLVSPAEGTPRWVPTHSWRMSPEDAQHPNTLQDTEFHLQDGTACTSQMCLFVHPRENHPILPEVLPLQRTWPGEPLSWECILKAKSSRTQAHPHSGTAAVWAMPFCHAFCFSKHQKLQPCRISTLKKIIITTQLYSN